MTFDRHLFISYAHLDNQPLTDGHQGWVTRFHHTLQALLSMQLGDEAQVWRDEARLAGNHEFDAEIMAQFEKTAVLVAVLSPRYLKSEWCQREIREFCEVAEKTGGASLDNKSRIFKVITTPVNSQDSLPEAAKKVLGYEFFVVQDDDTPLLLDPDYGDEFAQNFRQKVARLAWQVSQLVTDLDVADNDGDRAAEDRSSASDKPAVYLAECSSDRRDDRDMLEAELQRLGYPVVPDERLPVDEAQYVQAVDELLQGTALAIHLVGENYGLVPDGPTLKSAAMLQNELAAMQSRGSDFRRLIWLPEGTRSDQDVQQAFIDSLHDDAELQFGADLITGDLEALRATIHSTLEKVEHERATSDADPGGEANEEHSPRVYLMCDREDRKATVPIRKYFQSIGVEVDLPAFEGDARRVREANRDLLEHCTAVLLFYGSGDDSWKRAIDNELRKMPGYVTDRPMPEVYTYLAEPKTDDKLDLVDMEGPNLIVGFDGFDEASLSDFLRAARDVGAE